MGEAAAFELARQVRDDGPFVERLRTAADGLEKNYPASPYVEGCSMYEGGFPSAEDDALMRRFHTAAWEERYELNIRIADGRYRKLAMRILFYERPDCLPENIRSTAEAMLSDWPHAAADADVPWRRAFIVLREIEALMADNPRRDGSHPLESYAANLRGMIAAPAPQAP